MEPLSKPTVNDADNQHLTNSDTRAPLSIEPIYAHPAFIRLQAYFQANFEKAKAYIDKNPLKQKSTDFFADLTGFNRKVLQKEFKLQYQVTISQYQLQKRMEVAALLLQEGRLSQKQIASRCGYHNANNFSRAFKKVYKRSPKHYLKSC